MAQIDRPEACRVDIIEYERGWCSKLDDIKYFDNEPEARQYCADFNSRNYNDEVSDWFMVAEFRGRA